MKLQGEDGTAPWRVADLDRATVCPRGLGYNRQAKASPGPPFASAPPEALEHVRPICSRGTVNLSD